MYIFVQYSSDDDQVCLVETLGKYNIQDFRRNLIFLKMNPEVSIFTLLF